MPMRRFRSKSIRGKSNCMYSIIYAPKALIACACAGRASTQKRNVSQLHWGGGTPMYLNKAHISRLMKLVRENVPFNADAEISIEVDPREIELDVLDHLRAEGFTRLRMGVQDFNKEVQRLVNRE